MVSSALWIPSSSSSQNWEYDVFPSFHGKDVRKAFLSHVLKEFGRKAINFFVDNEIKRGEFIGPELKRAIKGSKIALVLLSKNYASSSWCLDELAEIMKKESGQTVITIFYEVDPTDVKKQKGDFGKVFKETCQGKDKEKIQTWRKALEDVATIAGYHSSNCVDEAAMIENVAAEISNKLNHLTPSRDFDCLIGMEAHMKRMEQYLRLDLDEVRMIGIWGPPGIGKTTIARFLFNQVSSRFQDSALIEDIKGSYPKPCFDEYKAKLQLQNKMLSKMINQKDIMIPHLGVAQERLRNRNVFLVLDDVDRLEQLEALAKNVQWFGPRSRIIITTEDRRLLNAHGINHIYKVGLPSNDEALQMFCMYAFNQKTPEDGFDALALEITYLVGELPLGLKVIGSHFRGLSKEQWSVEVSRLRTNLNGVIESILKFSYDALCDEDKDLFLHIACFFKYEMIKRVEELIGQRFKDLSQRLYVLEEKSLISIEKFVDDEYIKMHNLMAQLGKGIVRKEFREPGQRQFLVDYKDICEVVSTNTGSVVGINSKYGLNITEKAFEGMPNLQFLRVKYNPDHPNIISSSGPLTFISPKLRLIDWWYFPMTSFPFINNLEFLVELCMRYSKLEKLWDGIKLLRNLKRMNLSHSRNLKELPNLSMATSLEELVLDGCSRLMELPSSIGNSTNLSTLALDECSSLVELPSSVGNLTNLQKLSLRRCSWLVSLPQPPDSLMFLNAENCESLEKLDCSFCNPGIRLNFANCFKLNQEARDLLIQTSTVRFVVLPGKEVPACFTYRGYGNSVTVKLNQKPLPTSTKFKACILFGYEGKKDAISIYWDTTCVYTKKNKGCILLDNKGEHEERGSVSCRIRHKPNGFLNYYPVITEHLYIFEVEVEEVTSTDLVFHFEIFDHYSRTREIKECGIIHILERHVDGDEKMAMKMETNIRSSSGPLTFISPKLRFIDWSYFPMTSFPFINNLEFLVELRMNGSKLEKLWDGIKLLKNLKRMDLSYSRILKELPNLSMATSLEELVLEGCSSLVELPSSIGNSTNLSTLLLDGCSSLVELPSYVGNLTNLQKLSLEGCSRLVSLPQLPDSLLRLNANNCESLEKLDCSFCNPGIWLNFANCFKLNQEARDLLIETSTVTLFLPGKEVPACFTYRGYGNSVTVKLNQKPLPTSTKFKACILFGNNGENDVSYIYWDTTCVYTKKNKGCILLDNKGEHEERGSVSCCIRHKLDGFSIYFPIITEHLYIFEVEVEEVTSTELVFAFEIIDDDSKTRAIKECGIIHILEDHVDGDEKMAMKMETIEI